MGNDVSGNQGDLSSHGKRDVSDTPNRKRHDWLEQAEAPNTNTPSEGVKSYNGASNVGLKSSTEDNVRVGANVRSVPESYFDASGVGPSPSTEEDDTRRDAYSDASGTRPRLFKDETQYRKSSVMKDDTQSGAFGDTGLRNRKLPTTARKNSSSEEDGGLKTDERRQKSEDRRKKTKGIMQVEPETGQTAYTPRWQKTGSAMQVESQDPRSYPIQTAYTPTGSDVQVEPTDVQVHPGQTARLPTRSGMQIESLDQRSHLIQTACTPPSLATQRPEEDGLTALPSLQLKPIYMPDDDSARPAGHAVNSARPAGHAVAQQQEEEMAVEKELSALHLEDTVNRFLPEQQVHDFRRKPETEICDDLSYREEPVTEPEIEIKGEESLPGDNDNDVYQKGETETDAKAGVTRHLSRYPDGTSELATSVMDAKVSWTQHPSSGNQNVPMPNCRKIRINKPQEIKMPGRKSECPKQQNKQKCRRDRTEWRRAKRQGRHGGKLSTTTPAEGDSITKKAPQDLMSERIENTKQDLADLIRKRSDNPIIETLLKEYEAHQGFIKWGNPFFYRIDAYASRSEMSYVGEEVAYECGWQIHRLWKKIVLTGTDGAVAIGTVDAPIRVGKQILGLQLFVSPHVPGYLVLGQEFCQE